MDKLVRRKFDEAARAAKKAVSAKMALNIIGKLYRIEDEIREMDAAARQNVRQEKSRPVAEEFFTWLEKKTLEVNPESLMGKAVSYAFKLKTGLLQFLDDGHILLDNNLVENAIRPFVVGRKNWLFSGSWMRTSRTGKDADKCEAGSPEGAEASAGLYSLVETAKAADLDPYWCLRYIFEKLPTASESELVNLLPCNISRDTLFEHFIKE